MLSTLVRSKPDGSKFDVDFPIHSIFDLDFDSLCQVMDYFLPDHFDIFVLNDSIIGTYDRISDEPVFFSGTERNLLDVLKVEMGCVDWE